MTSTGSGLSVPDWPLSFGGFFPRMIGGVFFEHGHRVIAGVVSLQVFALAWLGRRPGVPALARRAAALAAAAILLQAILGGLTVLLRLPPAVSISHAALAQAVFCLLAAAAELSAGRPSAGASGVARLAWAALAAGFLQLLLGAFLRHTGGGLALHAAWGFAAAGLALAAAAAGRRAGIAGPAALLAVLVPIQLGLGWLAYRLRFDPTLTTGFREAAAWRTIHLVGGAAILGTLTVLGLRAREAR